MISWSYQIEAAPTATGTEATLADLRSVDVQSPKDWAIDQATGDLEIPFRLVSGAEAIGQRLWIRLGFFLGEWFLDTREGIPYLQSVLVSNPDLPMIDLLFQRVIRETPGVKSVLSYASELARATRTYSATFRVECLTGETIRFDSKPFIVPVGG